MGSAPIRARCPEADTYLGEVVGVEPGLLGVVGVVADRDHGLAALEDVVVEVVLDIIGVEPFVSQQVRRLQGIDQRLVVMIANLATGCARISTPPVRA